MLLDKVKNTIKEYGLIDKGDKIVVGVSGGPDSVALLYLLAGLRKELEITLHIAHLDHMLRPDSHKDRLFVEKLAEKLSIPATTTQVNIKELAKKGSLEEIARNARLGFLFRVARELHTDKIALGHNLDDQAETVLMRIIRGAGLYGLSGILPKRKIAGFYIVRPMLELRRKEIEAWLKKRKIESRIDRTNAEDVYLRNKLRNRLLPLLEKEYNRNIKEVLSNTAVSAGHDYDYLRQTAMRIARQTGSRINLGKFLKLHPAMQNLVLRFKFAQLKGDMRRLSFTHIKEINDLILNRPVNSVVDLPRGLSIVKKKKTLSLYLRHK